MSYLIPHLNNGWEVDQAILSEEERVVIMRFGTDGDSTCMLMDEVLASVIDKLKSACVTNKHPRVDPCPPTNARAAVGRCWEGAVTGSTSVGRAAVMSRQHRCPLGATRPLPKGSRGARTRCGAQSRCCLRNLPGRRLHTRS